ncbi:MAG: NAD(P)/FAD-dependent oxidoreductase, partial [Devosia sp.]|nr:NAD(P)/FAD-dependent oxidoreductase [Devosia sp.]
MSDYDYILVGAGINGLTAAAMLAKKGRKVLVLERNAGIGGCLKTEEITAPGFVHDVMATTMVLFLTSPAYGVIGKDLEARGLAFANCDTPTGVLRPDGSHLLYSMNRQANIAAFEAAATGDGGAFDREMAEMAADAPFLFSILGGSLWSGSMVKTLLKEAWRRGPRNLLAWFGAALASSRAHLQATYQSDLVHALWAPWGLHCGLGPESAYSAEMVKVIAFAVELAGCPIVVGGARTLLTAFERLIGDLGGEIRAGAEVAAIAAGAGGSAAGVRLATGEVIRAKRGVICSTTPDQLYRSLLKDWPTPLPDDVVEGLGAYRYGKGNMQMHYALKSPPRWTAGDELAQVALLHLTPGLDGVSRASNEAERGLLP